MKTIEQLIYRHKPGVVLDEESFGFVQDMTVLRVSFDKENVTTLYCNEIDEMTLNDGDMFLEVELFDDTKNMFINKNTIITFEQYEAWACDGEVDGVPSRFFYACNSGDRYDKAIVYDEPAKKELTKLETIITPFFTCSEDELEDDEFDECSEQ